MKKTLKRNKVFVLVIAVILVLSSVWYVLYHGQDVTNSVESSGRFSSTAANVRFAYPQNMPLEITESKDMVQITHAIPFTKGLCANESGQPQFDKERKDGLFDELGFQIKIANSNMNEIYPDFETLIKPDEYGDAYLKSVNIGDRDGYYAVKAVEFCGTIEYYFPLRDRTLIISKDSEAAVVRNMGRLNEIPNSLSNEEVEQLFDTIVRTAQHLK